MALERHRRVIPSLAGSANASAPPGASQRGEHVPPEPDRDTAGFTGWRPRAAGRPPALPSPCGHTRVGTCVGMRPQPLLRSRECVGATPCQEDALAPLAHTNLHPHSQRARSCPLCPRAAGAECIPCCYSEISVLGPGPGPELRWGRWGGSPPGGWEGWSLWPPGLCSPGDSRCPEALLQ